MSNVPHPQPSHIHTWSGIASGKGSRRRLRRARWGKKKAGKAFSTAQTVRLRKVEADQSNLDAALSARADILELRLSQIEEHLGAK